MSNRLTVSVPVRWSDIDAYSHVNNAELLRILEEARITAFWASSDPAAPQTAILDATPGAATATLIARLEIEYLRPIPYQREPLAISMWISHLGGASLDLCYEVHNAAGTEKYAHALTTVVMADAITQKPRRVTSAERAAWQGLLGPAPQFRRR